MALPGLDLRDGLVDLSGRAKDDLAGLWRRITDAARAEEALHDILPALIETYGAAAATMAAEWYDDARAKADAPGRFTAIPVEPDDRGAHALVGWALSSATDLPSFQSLVEGGMQRRITDHGRGTIVRSSAADPQSTGWKRIGAGACPFCRMLIQRDQLYTEATADFAAHDDCKCQAYPLIKGAEPIDVKKYVKSSRYIEDDEDRAKANARVREWMADNL